MLNQIARLHELAPEREPNYRTKKSKFSREHVFVNGASARYTNNLLREFYRIGQEAGIEGCHRNGTVDIHALRGTFATLSLENGANPKAVQDILGHSTLDMTMKIYAKATNRSKRDAVDALPFAKAKTPEGVVPMKRKKKTG